MRGSPNKAWGKLYREKADEDPPEWHPLADHCADVAACLEAMLSQPIFQRRLTHLGGPESYGTQVIQRLAAIAFLHDLGKANRGFQNKQFPLAILKAEHRPTAGHVGELYPLFSNESLHTRLSTALHLPEMQSWGHGSALYGLLIASVSHHGTPWNPRKPVQCHSLWEASNGYDPFETLAELGSLMRSWFPEAFSPGGAPINDSAPFQHGYAGLIMLADWMGSDTRFFPYSSSEQSDRMSFARLRAREVIHIIGLNAEENRRALKTNKPKFEDIFGFSAYPAQSLCSDPTLGRLVILESETGSGKTEAALWRFCSLFETGQVDGLYFALPTRVAATQIHERVTKIVRAMFPEHARPLVVLAVPGYLRTDEIEGRLLPGFEVQWHDHPDQQEAHRRWAAEHPKRFLSAQISIGTIDQVLLSNLRVRHAHMRSSALLRHLVVVDEVHASDPYMTALLQSVLSVHLQAGGHALLMSATLGSSAREQFLGEVENGTVLEEAIDVPYPALSHSENCAKHTLPVKAVGRSKHVKIVTHPWSDEPANIATIALKAARSGAKVLVISKHGRCGDQNDGGT